MTKTIRDTILAYPGLADCEDFLDNVVLPGRGFEGTEDSKTIDIQKQKLVAADLYSMVGGLPDFTENKLSITYPRAWYDATAKRLYREGGEPEKAELIGNKIEVPKEGRETDGKAIFTYCDSDDSILSIGQRGIGCR